MLKIAQMLDLTTRRNMSTLLLRPYRASHERKMNAERSRLWCAGSSADSPERVAPMNR
jgi:hypothetical protein